MDNRDYDKALDKCWNKFCKSKPTLSKQAGVLTLFNFIFDYLYPIEKHNLTSDAEGEEMLYVKAKTVREMYAANERIKTDAPDKELGRTSDHINHVLRCLFGSKCLPDETQNLSNLDKIGKDCNVDSLSQDSPENCDNADRISDGNNHSHKSPDTCKCPNNVQKNNNDLGHLSQFSSNLDKQFDSILKDSLRNHNRLHIAAMAMQGILSNADRMKQYGEIAMRESEGLTQLVARNAMRYADALIAESEKGDVQ